MVRLFVAVDIPENIKEKIVELQKNIGEKFADIKFVEEENLHYTIKFLGEVEEQKIEEVKNILSEASNKFERFSNFSGFLSFFSF